MNYDAVEFRRKRERYDSVWKKIENYEKRRPLTKNRSKRMGYLNDFVKSYNEITSYLHAAYATEKDIDIKIQHQDNQVQILSKFKRAVKILKYEYTFSSKIFDQIHSVGLIDIRDPQEEEIERRKQKQETIFEEEKEEQLEEEVSEEDSESESISSEKSAVSLNNKSKTPENRDKTVDAQLIENEHLNGNTVNDEEQAIEVEQEDIDLRLRLFEELPLELPLQTVDYDEFEYNYDTIEMAAMELPAFMSLMAANIRSVWDGEPSGKRPFIASLKLLKTFAITDPLETLLVQFAMTKLSKRAIEIVPQNAKKIDEIIDALEGKIQDENSKVVEGKMAALRADRGNLQDYAKKAEDLADAFRRALISEGISLNKAEQMTIDRTVELCRDNAHNSIVKSVLASKQFNTPAEVISNYIVETSKTKQEAQVLAMRKFQTRNNNNNYRGGQRNQAQRGGFNGYRGNNGNNRGGYRNNRGYNNNGGNRGGWRNNNQNNYNNGSNNRNGNWRNNGQNSNNNNTGNNNNRQNRNVRVAENRSTQSTLGAPDQ